VPELTRLTVCLLHTAPGTSATITTPDGRRLVVGHQLRDAATTPCELRAGLLQPRVAGVPHVADVIGSIELVGGLVDLGAGVHQRTSVDGGDERWFATTLPAPAIAAIAATCPPDVDHADVELRVCADPDLGACAVRLSAPRTAGWRLDEVACWLHGRCLVEELLDVVGAGAPAA
jgi:hypothetical protein